MPTETLTTVTMPQLGESVVEGTIGAWLKEIGERIDKYESLAEVESDKANAEVPSPVTGVLVEILVDPGTTVAVGTELCRIQEDSANAVKPGQGQDNEPASANGSSAIQASSPAAPVSARKNGEIVDEAVLLRTRSSPFVRRTAEEHGIDITRIAGTGADGRVTKRDILGQIALRGSPGEAPRSGESVPAARPLSDQPSQRVPVAVYPGDEVIQVTPMRRTIAEHMVRSERTAPHATVVMEVDMTAVVIWRAARKDNFRRREGVELTYLPIVLKAVTQALADSPRLNAVWDEDRIIHRKAINIGIAVALEDGLVVPVIRNAERLSLAGLAHSVAELSGRSRDGTFAPDDLAGGTFTVNNTGAFGSLVSTPILVQPQVAILSTEAIVKRPVVVDDMIGIRSMMNLSLSIDHRALDGLAAARFLQQVRSWLESVSDDLPLY